MEAKALSFFITQRTLEINMTTSRGGIAVVTHIDRSPPAGLKHQPHLIPAERPWTGESASLDLRFSIYKMGW